jgi:hypothetical protein
MKFIPNVVTAKVARQVLTVQKHSPQILFVAGIAGAITSTVIACKSTLKLEAVIDDIEYDVKDVKTHRDEYSTDYYKDLTYIYAKGAYRVGKLYAPAVILGTASIGALTGSHVTLTRRNAGLTAAYAATQKAFDEYRERVQEQLGEKKEADIHHAVQVLDVVDENGKKVKVPHADPNKWSMYARFFDEASVNWQKNAELNRIFVQAQQNYCNHLLHARGHVFLNEVYDMLGIPRCKAGQVVGWVLGEGGDGFIDFGMYEAANADFVNGAERNIILDFNVDGVIYDKI